MIDFILIAPNNIFLYNNYLFDYFILFYIIYI